MRQAYVGPGVDESAVVKEARQRSEPTIVHRHIRSCMCSVAGFGPCCDSAKCFTIGGQDAAH